MFCAVTMLLRPEVDLLRPRQSATTTILRLGLPASNLVTGAPELALLRFAPSSGTDVRPRTAAAALRALLPARPLAPPTTLRLTAPAPPARPTTAALPTLATATRAALPRLLGALAPATIRRPALARLTRPATGAPERAAVRVEGHPRPLLCTALKGRCELTVQNERLGLAV